jgi:hypothetical protein
VQARLNEINAMLRPDGMFHAAEGFCDMTYPEQKIYAIGKALLKANRLDGLIIADNRVPSHPYTVTLIPGKKIAVKEGSTDEDLERQVKIDDNGYVYIPLNLARKCKELKASTLVEIGDYIVMSLIDEAVEEDITNHIKPVADFYRPVNIEIANMQPREGVSAELIRQTVQVDFEEWCNAKRGLVEYYMSEGVWGKLLSGFSSFEVKRPNTDGKGFDGLINIVAYK